MVFYGFVFSELPLIYPQSQSYNSVFILITSGSQQNPFFPPFPLLII